MKSKSLARHFLTLLVISFFCLLAFGSGESGSSSSSSSSRKDLNASIRFSATQFLITNNDSYSWTNTKLTVNDKYTLHAGTISAGGEYTVGMAQFAKSDGERFNPFSMKALNMSISCDQGFYYGATQ